MRIVDLTLPLKDGMDYYCTGHLPWEVPFKAQRTVPPEVNWDLGSFTMYSEPGTRFLSKPPKKVGDLFKKEVDQLLFREAVLLNIPKKPKEKDNLITAAEIKAGIKDCPARKGDAVILHTGYGDDETYLKLGQKWELWCPGLHPEAVDPLVSYLKGIDCTLFGYDTPNLSWQCTDLCSLHHEWTLRKPRPAVPDSPEAKEATKNYILSGRMAAEFKNFSVLTSGFDMIGCVVNCGEIKAERFKLVVAPLKVVDWAFVPATIFAVVD
jgi:kynurenine formamidase